VDAEHGVRGIILATELPDELEMLDRFLQLRGLLGQVGQRLLVVLLDRQLMEPQDIGTFIVGMLPGLDDSFDVLDPLERLLRLFRVIPELGFSRQPLEFLDLLFPGIYVKDTPEGCRFVSPGPLPYPDRLLHCPP
jgi:hypothetical protein